MCPNRTWCCCAKRASREANSWESTPPAHDEAAREWGARRKSPTSYQRHPTLCDETAKDGAPGHCRLCYGCDGRRGHTRESHRTDSQSRLRCRYAESIIHSVKCAGAHAVVSGQGTAAIRNVSISTYGATCACRCERVKWYKVCPCGNTCTVCQDRHRQSNV